MLAVYPEPEPDHKPRIFKDNYRYRGWFHGGNDMRDKHGHPLPADDVRPLKAPYFIGRPLRSLVTNEPLVTISAPITDPADKTVLGVLVAGVSIDSLHEWLTENTNNSALVVLIDKEGHCLLHKKEWRDTYLPKDRTVELPVFARGYQALLSDKPTGSVEAFLDPVDKETYIASFAPILKHSSWKAVIERNPKEIDARKNELEDSHWHFRLRGLAVVFALVGGLWAWLLWLMRR
jgi:hypothetical protein